MRAAREAGSEAIFHGLAYGTMGFDPEQLLLSRRLEHVTTDPFCFFYVDDYLPADLYQGLLASYPNESNYRFNAEGKMGFRSSEDPEAIERYCDTHPEWRQLIDFFGSDRFLADMRDVFAKPLVQARGLPAPALDQLHQPKLGAPLVPSKREDHFRF